MLYMVTFTINIPPMLAYIPYMDPMDMLVHMAERKQHFGVTEVGILSVHVEFLLSPTQKHSKTSVLEKQFDLGDGP